MEVKLTEDEIQIIRALRRLSTMWKKGGQNLLLFNGNSLRYKGTDDKHEIEFFSGIRGDGGDGGDTFE